MVLQTGSFELVSARIDACMHVHAGVCISVCVGVCFMYRYYLSMRVCVCAYLYICMYGCVEVFAK